MPNTISLADLYALIRALPAEKPVTACIDERMHAVFDLEFLDGRAVILPLGNAGRVPEASAQEVAEFIANEFYSHPATTPVYMRDRQGHDWPLYRHLFHTGARAVIHGDQSFLRLDVPDCVRLMYTDSLVRSRIAQRPR